MRLLSTLTILACAGPAFAGDGILEINQVCAVQTGCFAGDAAGFPVTIAAPGSHRLTSDLIVPDLNTTAISVATDDVSIDLAGFAIRGPNACTVASCGSVGAGAGVEKDSLLVNRMRISVTNGLISGMGGNGISLGDEARVEGLSVSSCGGNGIVVLAHSLVQGNRIVSNRQRGLFLGTDSAFADNVIALAGLGQVAGRTETVVGGRATGGNVCDDRRCSPNGRKTYYLTVDRFDGAHALTACEGGFHMAHFAEIENPTVLDYDARGLVAPSSVGPPTDSGWIRNGKGPLSGSGQTLYSNCNEWTTTSGFGGTARYVGLDEATNSFQMRWAGFNEFCDAVQHVWCVSDQ